MAPAANQRIPAPVLVLMLALHRAGAVSQLPLFGEWQEQYIQGLPSEPASSEEASFGDAPEPQLLVKPSQTSSAAMLADTINSTEKLLAQGRSDIRSLTEALLALDQFTKGAARLEQHTGGKRVEMENTIAVLTRSISNMKQQYSDVKSQLADAKSAEESTSEVLRQLQEQQAQQSEQWSADRERLKALATKATDLYKQWTSDRSRMQQLAEARKADAEKAKVWQQMAYAAEQARGADVEQARQHKEELGAALKKMQEAEERAAQGRMAQQLAEEEAVSSRKAQQLAEEEAVTSRMAQQLAEEGAISVGKMQERLQSSRAEHS